MRRGRIGHIHLRPSEDGSFRTMLDWYRRCSPAVLLDRGLVCVISDPYQETRINLVSDADPPIGTGEDVDRGNVIEVDEDQDVRSSLVLRRVIPVALVQSSDTLAITLYSIEDYAAGFTIRGELLGLKGHPVRELHAARIEAQQALLQAKLKELRHAPPNLNVAPMIAATGSEGSRPNVTTAFWPTPAWKMRDDRGNAYEARQWGGTSSGLGGFSIEYSFTPAIDQEVRWLIFETPEVAWTSLPPNDEPPVWVDCGSWVFQIDLTSGLDVRRSIVGGV